MGKKKHTIFIQQFIKSGRQVGSVSPSSKSLTRKIINAIDFQEANSIFEFGPGTGVFTREVIKHMNDDAHLKVFELNHKFFKELKTEFKEQTQIQLFNKSASEALRLVENKTLDKPDVIISSLPLANFDKQLTYKILKGSSEILSMDGKFIQYQYTLSERKMLNSIFEDVKIEFTLFNLPPAFVYICQKNKPD